MANKNGKKFDSRFQPSKRVKRKMSVASKDNYGFWSSLTEGPDHTDFLANYQYQYIEIMHIPSATKIAFKAAITQFNDLYKSDWSRTEVYGRMDPIGTFQRTSRSISVGFDVMAASFEEAEVNLQKMDLFTNMAYPVYDSERGPSIIQGGPLLKIHFMNWMSNGNDGNVDDSGLVGWIDSVQYSPDVEIGVFQEGRKIYPKRFSVQFTFFVIHQENSAPGWRNREVSVTAPAGRLSTESIVLRNGQGNYGTEVGDVDTLRFLGQNFKPADIANKEREERESAILRKEQALKDAKAAKARDVKDAERRKFLESGLAKPATDTRGLLIDPGGNAELNRRAGRFISRNVVTPK
jgi:hypothetical protein